MELTKTIEKETEPAGIGMRKTVKTAQELHDLLGEIIKNGDGKCKFLVSFLSYL